MTKRVKAGEELKAGDAVIEKNGKYFKLRTKQEEIREGVLQLIAEPVDITLGQLTDEILSYLHAKGVVIKVDRELPETTRWGQGTEAFLAYNIGIGEMLKAGYVAVEELIDTKKWARTY